MAQKKIFILLGHPNADTFTGAIASAYESAALSAGHEVRRQNIGDMRFDPILHKGYRVIQELEPDLKTFQSNVQWADHFVVAYPNWWCTMPALLKGLFDRAWLPGFAFRFHSNRLGWDRLLKGKTARVLICAGSHPYLIRFVFGEFTNELARGILWFSGFTPKVTVFGPTDEAPAKRCNRWIGRARSLGARGV